MQDFACNTVSRLVDGVLVQYLVTVSLLENGLLRTILSSVEGGRIDLHDGEGWVEISSIECISEQADALRKD